MEAQEEVIGYSKHQTHMIMIKGKRTKRPRPPSPLALTMASTTSSTTTTEEHGSTSGVSEDSGGFFHLAAASLSSSPENANIEFTKIIQQEDEEDMANCLILLAQGQAQAHQSFKRNNGELYVYECKTCNRAFPSFQALGGHRASHKKPKSTLSDEKKVPLQTLPKIESNISNNYPITLSLQINPTKALCTTTTTKNSKIHECSICGAEFTSGQALGGHMRRHRAIAMPPPVAISTTSATSNESQEGKKSRALLSLDLNLPAPEDNVIHESRFPYGSKEKIIVFSSSSLVDCHF